MEYEGPIRFGDNVRIRDAEETRAAGVAGLVGQVYGETTPSVTHVEVIGTPREDFALNVSIEGQDADLWFAAELLEFVDHAPGTKLQIGDVTVVRGADGQWLDRSSGKRATELMPPSRKKRRWWRFW